MDEKHIIVEKQIVPNKPLNHLGEEIELFNGSLSSSVNVNIDKNFNDIMHPKILQSLCVSQWFSLDISDNTDPLLYIQQQNRVLIDWINNNWELKLGLTRLPIKLK